MKFFGGAVLLAAGIAVFAYAVTTFGVIGLLT